MEFKDYQKKARKTAIYPNIDKNYIYPTLGLVGEAGEIANKVKKIMRDHDNELSEEMILDLGKEIGDVLWYIAALCSELDLDLNKVAQANIDKLLSRKERNQIQGNGDNR